MEYNNKKIIGFAIFIIIFGNACKTSFPVGKKNREENMTWQKLLNKSDTSIKKYWLELIDGNLSVLKNIDIYMTETDLLKLKLFPSSLYTLDSLGIMSINSEIKLGKLFELDKKKAVYYGLIEDTIKIVIYPQYISNSFSNGQGYSNIFPLLGKKLSTLISKNIVFYQLDVIAFPSSKSHLMSYIFYVNNQGEFISLQTNGSEVSLKNLLLALQQRVLEIQKQPH